MKRTLSALLSVLMIFGTLTICIPATVSAAPRYEGSGKGTVATAEETQAVEDAVSYTKLPLGGWVTPNNAGYRDDMLAAYRKLVDAGLNFMVTVDEIYSPTYMGMSAYSAYLAGMDLYVNPTYTVFDYEYSAEMMKMASEFPSVKGFWFGDEPGLDAADDFIARSNQLMAALDNEDLIYGANVFPTFGPVGDDYEEYVNTFVEGTQKYDDNNNKIDKLSSDFICFDYYTHYGTPELDGLIDNIIKVKSVADGNDVDMYSYIRVSDMDTFPEPTKIQLNCNMNTNLALGVKGIMYYMACQQSPDKGQSAILNYDGSEGSTYKIVKEANAAADAMKGVYLSFDNEGMISTNTVVKNAVNNIHPEYLLDSYKQLTSVDAKNALVGCFTKGEGDDAQTGLYVVNETFNAAGSEKITLNFDSSVSYQIWGSDGLEQMGTDSKLVLDISSGDAKFVILNSVNNPDGYTPVEPKPEKPDFDEARINSLVFDLGYGEDGVPYNKVSGGLGLMDGAYGTVTTNDDKTVLTDYSFQTEMIKNLYPANCGVTVELYVKFTAEDDVDVYRDKLSNFNLYRWSESKQLWFGMAQGTDVTTGSVRKILPKDQWLHIVTTQTVYNQALYVNGNKAAVGGYDFDPTYISSVLFEAGETVFLKDLRIYTYAVDQKEAVMMYKDVIGEPTGALDGFEDLEAGAWYEEALETVVRRNLFGGMAENEFCPDVDMSRAMFVTVLSRLVKADLSAYEDFESPFEDVTTDQWFYKEVCWAYDNGLVSGMTPTTFGPDGKLTREQMCVLIVRFAEKYGYDLSETVDAVTFEDENKIGTWAIEAVKTCQKAGIVSGMTPTTFVPGGNASRAQVAMIFTRLMNK